MTDDKIELYKLAITRCIDLESMEYKEMVYLVKELLSVNYLPLDLLSITRLENKYLNPFIQCDKSNNLENIKNEIINGEDAEIVDWLMNYVFNGSYRYCDKWHYFIFACCLIKCKDIEMNRPIQMSTEFVVHKYLNKRGNSSVYAYDYGDDYIMVIFNKGPVYVYTRATIGLLGLEFLKKVADRGYGLASIIHHFCYLKYIKVNINDLTIKKNL